MAHMTSCGPLLHRCAAVDADERAFHFGELLLEELRDLVQHEPEPEAPSNFTVHTFAYIYIHRK